MEPYDVVVNQPVVIDNVSERWGSEKLGNWRIRPVSSVFPADSDITYCPSLCRPAFKPSSVGQHD